MLHFWQLAARKRPRGQIIRDKSVRHSNQNTDIKKANQD